MKMIINEKQFTRILNGTQNIDEVDATSSTITTVPMASVASGPTTPSVVPSSSGLSSGGSSTNTDDIGSSPGAADMPPYPEVDHAEDKVQRGPANQVATKSNWTDVVGSTLTRGPANPIKGM